MKVLVTDASYNKLTRGFRNKEPQSITFRCHPKEVLDLISEKQIEVTSDSDDSATVEIEVKTFQVKIHSSDYVTVIIRV